MVSLHPLESGNRLQVTSTESRICLFGRDKDQLKWKDDSLTIAREMPTSGAWTIKLPLDKCGYSYRNLKWALGKCASLLVDSLLVQHKLHKYLPHFLILTAEESRSLPVDA